MELELTAICYEPTAPTQTKPFSNIPWLFPNFLPEKQTYWVGANVIIALDYEF